MNELTRRRFLTASALIGGAAALGGASAITLDILGEEAELRPIAPQSSVLVIVTLYGGNDGLNMVVPYTDNAYFDGRPELAYNPSEVLPLDDHLGLNPSMKGLQAAWSSGELGVVRGVGYPKPDRSHFRSMDIWQTAVPDSPAPTGWIGRWLDQGNDDPLRAVNIGSVLPPLMVGEKRSAAAIDTGKPITLSGRLYSVIEGLAKPDQGDTGAFSAVARSYANSITAGNQLKPVQRDLEKAKAANANEPDASSGSAGAQSELAKELAVVAACILARVPTRVYSVSLGGFDTHADEKGTQQKLMGDLDSALTGFMSTLRKDPAAPRTTVMVYSEFGRRVKANASQGTDHGTAGPVLLLGPQVSGGKFYGDAPSLTDLDAGDLKVTTDFRDVYGTLLGGLLQHDPADIVGPSRKDLGFLKQ